jgi:2-keto-4-pentenoate hydratase/2-oxohepta-3-ene-1,7-dioic acid hydratase in catechol pathway
MIFTVAQIISYLSESTTLAPGTLILTGTPGGVGFGQKPPKYMKAGDEVRSSSILCTRASRLHRSCKCPSQVSVMIEKIGELRNFVTN